ncbi:MAG: hypothetical protein GF308_08835 [Candidatus Heimdallarchaeota archaeon]|nr:hypothetical protein [Candidatus Heimdallarchaeota archaeon]
MVEELIDCWIALGEESKQLPFEEHRKRFYQSWYDYWQATRKHSLEMPIPYDFTLYLEGFSNDKLVLPSNIEQIIAEQNFFDIPPERLAEIRRELREDLQQTIGEKNLKTLTHFLFDVVKLVIDYSDVLSRRYYYYPLTNRVCLLLGFVCSATEKEAVGSFLSEKLVTLGWDSGLGRCRGWGEFYDHEQRWDFTFGLRADIAQALAVLGWEGAVPALIEMMTKEQQIENNVTAARALGKIGGEEAVTALRKARYGIGHFAWMEAHYSYFECVSETASTALEELGVPLEDFSLLVEDFQRAGYSLDGMNLLSWSWFRYYASELVPHLLSQVENIENEFYKKQTITTVLCLIYENLVIEKAYKRPPSLKEKNKHSVEEPLKVDTQYPLLLRLYRRFKENPALQREILEMLLDEEEGSFYMFDDVQFKLFAPVTSDEVDRESLADPIWLEKLFPYITED